MINLIRGEAIKMRHARTAMGAWMAGVALTLLVVLVSTLADEPSTVSGKRDAITVAPIFILFVVFGVVGATSMPPPAPSAVLIAPDRLRLLLARALAYAVTAAGVALVMQLVGIAIQPSADGGQRGRGPGLRRLRRAGGRRPCWARRWAARSAWASARWWASRWPAWSACWCTCSWSTG